MKPWTTDSIKSNSLQASVETPFRNISHRKVESKTQNIISRHKSFWESQNSKGYATERIRVTVYKYY